ncbi:EIF4H [Bugula neritina]|uniref:EIF4H n=1 Tax=Bugula neritina TaxID=10212 RepID=A0A7J7KLI1_BUGNE|nr:EIF4H [Bugula neritina]
MWSLVMLSRSEMPWNLMELYLNIKVFEWTSQRTGGETTGEEVEVEGEGLITTEGVDSAVEEGAEEVLIRTAETIMIAGNDGYGDRGGYDRGGRRGDDFGYNRRPRRDSYNDREQLREPSPESAAARPRLNLLPRSKPVEEKSKVDGVTNQMRNVSIFGSGKPREAQPEDFAPAAEGASRSRNVSESVE